VRATCEAFVLRDEHPSRESEEYCGTLMGPPSLHAKAKLNKRVSRDAQRNAQRRPNDNEPLTRQLSP